MLETPDAWQILEGINANNNSNHTTTKSCMCVCVSCVRRITQKYNNFERTAESNRNETVEKKMKKKVRDENL